MYLHISFFNDKLQFGTKFKNSNVLEQCFAAQHSSVHYDNARDLNNCTNVKAHTFVPSRARVFASDDKIALKRYNR